MRALTAALAACAALAGCGGQPVPYHSGNEIPQGPGLLTGKEGAWVVRPGRIEPTSSDAPPSSAPRTAEEEREFREWREWKQRQEKGR